jgi:hypothetical protein
MAFWNSRDDDDEAAQATADRLEATATGLPPSTRPDERRGFYASPMGLIAAAVAVILALLFFTPVRDLSAGPWFGQREPWVPRGEAVYASQRLADIAAQQQIADARAAAWEDVPAVDAHVGTFAAQSSPR